MKKTFIIMLSVLILNTLGMSGNKVKPKARSNSGSRIVSQQRPAAALFGDSKSISKSRSSFSYAYKTRDMKKSGKKNSIIGWANKSVKQNNVGSVDNSDGSSSSCDYAKRREKTKSAIDLE